MQKHKILRNFFCGKLNAKEVFILAFQQVIAGKVKLNGIGGIRRHLQERECVKTNPNINLARSHLNYCVEGLTPDHLVSRVNFRIKQLNLKKHPRSDAVGLEDIIIGASSEFMLALATDKREQYFVDALHFFQQRYGKENVMYCQCHLDESNPHIHVGIVPVTSDGRLSAKNLFSPKTLEQLQTDFHRAVSSLYGLERGEPHAKKYLPLQQFKAKQTKIAAHTFIEDLKTATMDIKKIDAIVQSTHFATSGFIFPSEDKNTIQIDTQDFLTLKQFAENGVKATTLIDILKDDIEKLRRDDTQTNSDLRYFLHQLHTLEKSTANYTAVPKAWRKHIDDSINQWQKTFTSYCHDVNRATVRVFIATHGDFNKTVAIMRALIQKTGVADVENRISKVINAAIKQFKSNSQPQILPYSWKSPKPSDTDYKKADETGIVPLQLSSEPDINWDIITWDLLSNIEKDAIRIKKIVREL